MLALVYIFHALSVENILEKLPRETIRRNENLLPSAATDNWPTLRDYCSVCDGGRFIVFANLFRSNCHLLYNPDWVGNFCSNKLQFAISSDLVVRYVIVRLQLLLVIIFTLFYIDQIIIENDWKSYYLAWCALIINVLNFLIQSDVDHKEIASHRSSINIEMSKTMEIILRERERERERKRAQSNFRLKPHLSFISRLQTFLLKSYHCMTSYIFGVLRTLDFDSMKMRVYPETDWIKRKRTTQITRWGANLRCERELEIQEIFQTARRNPRKISPNHGGTENYGGPTLLRK